MPSNTAASMFGGAGGRGARASVASLEGLRNVLRNEPDKGSAPVTKDAAPTAASPAPAAAPAAPVAPADDKQTLRGLNGRLSGFLDRVRQLQEENRDLQKQIDDILAKRQAPEGRKWDEVQKPLDDLRKQVKDIAKDNAKLMLQIDNTKLANNDFNNKLKDEENACKELEKDLEDLKKVIDVTKLNKEQTEKETELVKDEIARLEREHKNEVDVLREKIRDSEVKVVIDSQDSNLADIVKNIRLQYEKLSKKYQQETEDWYKSKFENIKVEEAQNNEALQTGKSELKELLKQKQTLEIKIQSSLSTICNLEDNLRLTKMENSQRLGPINQVVRDLEAELKKVRSQVEHQVKINKNLLCVKMKLEAEINNYQELIYGMTSDADSLEVSLGDAVDGGQQKPEELKAVMEERAPSNQSA
ncbi:keratin, type I cytoskeletal 18-like isoform X1 [Parambassis ranga]|uniref:Keratin, type I cytoskeletal 18-like isoform X1 n=1 Tax=Parambassis ranga TaxID=210632 RepID=A0A6P7H9P3_9TELE|nr:keratin, type I cytoskeletal 18-like isoform X1 [Parambassis ranga]